jgi:restriction system protein
MGQLFGEVQRILKPERYFALMFRPIKAPQWLHVLNRLKFLARKAGFEPLLTIDIDSADPSMRVQQSASYAFVDDLIMLFIKLPQNIRRWIIGDHDIDQIVFQTAEKLQERLSRSISYKEWRQLVSKEFTDRGLHELNLPKYEERLLSVFKMYCDEVEPQRFLTKHLTPFSGQLFDVPATERIFLYVPKVVEELNNEGDQFSYSEFILKLSQFLENGTRSLISEISNLDMKDILETYAEQIPGTKYFKRRALPNIPGDIKKVMDLDPYQFEIFVGHLLQAQGFTNVVVAGRSGDRGVDLIAKDPAGKMTIIQCKQWIRNNVGTTPVQRLDSFARTRKADRKILITTSDFTLQGTDEAKITGTEIINGDQLGRLIALFMPEFPV